MIFLIPLGPSDRIRRLQIVNRLREFNLADPNHCFNRTSCTRGYVTRQVLKFLKTRSGFELKFFGFLLSGKLCLSPLVLGPVPEC